MMDLAVLVIMANSIMNLLPWGGPTARIIAALKVDEGELLRKILPGMAIAIVWVIIVAVLRGLSERKRLGIVAMSPEEIAGLRAHLRARIDAGARRTWLLFGERTQAHDFYFGDELTAWQQAGWIEHLDTVFSRDGGEHRYVQDRLQAHIDRLWEWSREGATILVCGSLQGMAPAVDAVIERALGREGKEALIVAGRYRRDVY